MASLKSKRKVEAKIEKLDNEAKYLNKEEEEILKEQIDRGKEEDSKVSIARMEKAIEVVSQKFNLTDDNFALTGFSDKGNKFQMSLSNEDFDITVLVKDTEKFEIV